MKSILSIFKAAPHITPIKDKEKIKKLYNTMRIRMMYTSIVGYAAYYLVRKNFSMAMPSFLSELGYTKTDLGLILALFSVIYGLGKFFNGMLADRSNPRYFMALGLIGAAVMNIFFGMSSSLIFLGIFWLLNAWFQSMGWPPCARILTHWYCPKELGTWWGIWNSSHQIGGAGILILAGFLISNFGWRTAFYFPAFLALLAAMFLLYNLRDTPRSLGLPSIEKYRGYVKESEEQDELEDLTTKEILFNHVLNNKFIWLLCAANFFVYIVRIGVLDWAPTYLVEAKGSGLASAGFKVAGFEIAGILGAFAAGWISDTIFKGRRGPVNFIFMLLIIGFLFYFWKTPAGHPWLDALSLTAIGFLIYGPQMLVAVAAADFASKKAAATATGLTGTFGYLGSTVCAVCTGVFVDKWGWDGGFIFYITCAIIGTLLFIPTLTQRSKTLDNIHV
jgi:glycerol-3-phosphate transporter